jgi:hypothetical protein
MSSIDQKGHFLHDTIERRWVGTREATVTADHDQAIDPAFEQVLGCLEASLTSAEGFAAGSTNNCPAALHDPSGIGPIDWPDVGAAINHALVTYKNGVDRDAMAERRADAARSAAFIPGASPSLVRTPTAVEVLLPTVSISYTATRAAASARRVE